MVKNSSEDLVFFDCRGEELRLCQSFLLLVWSIATCCIKVGQLVQSLAAPWFTQSINHASPIPQVEVVAKPTQVSLCLNLKLATQFEDCLFPPLPSAIAITHIIPCLPRTPLMLWHLHWVNKIWFTIVGKSLSWNALKVVRLDHKCYLNYIREHGMKRWSLQAHFELLLHNWEFGCNQNLFRMWFKHGFKKRP